MAVVTFYEKPGCKGNLRQKTLLAAAGHTVQAKNLKTETWTADRLLAFLGKLPVSAWFNPAAPAIKSGEIVPDKLGFEDALHLLLSNPLLIRRPLMEIGDERQVGFDIVAVDAWIGLKNIDLPAGDIEACVHGPEGHGSCGSHAHDDETGEGQHGRCGSH
jgi:nitrogenase-associated protein